VDYRAHRGIRRRIGGFIAYTGTKTRFSLGARIGQRALPRTDRNLCSTHRAHDNLALARVQLRAPRQSNGNDAISHVLETVKTISMTIKQDAVNARRRVAPKTVPDDVTIT
jgi:hypothetical protein